MILQQEFDPAVTSLCVAARCLREAARGNVKQQGVMCLTNIKIYKALHSYLDLEIGVLIFGLSMQIKCAAFRRSY